MNSIKTMIDASSFVDNFETYANTQHTKREDTRLSEDSRRKPQTGERVEEGRVSAARFFWYAPTPAMGKKEPGKKKNKTKQTPHCLRSLTSEVASTQTET